MTAPESTQGSQAAYDFWLGLIPQFLGQFGGLPGAVSGTPGGGNAVPEGLKFPIDQIAKAATLTQQSLQQLTQVLAAALQAGGPGLLAQWAGATPAFTFAKPGDATAAANPAEAMLVPWTGLIAGAMPLSSAAPLASPSTTAAPAPAPLQAMSQAWVDMASRLAGTSPKQADAAFDRAYGALSDGLGLGPSRKLQAAWRDMFAASIAQQDARVHYATLVQGAFAEGYQRLLTALAAKADAGERIDSVLALIRLWTLNAEQAVHEALQSEHGLAATAALIRADVAYRRKMQQVATVLAEQFDMASRRDLDEAYREIQALKRELRQMRGAPDAQRAARKRAPTRRRAAKSSRTEDGRVDSHRVDQ